MVEALVGQADRDDFEVEVFFDFRMRFNLGPKPETGPQPRSTPVDQAIASALETDLFVEFEKIKAVVPEPLLEDRLLRAALHRHEVARDGLVAIDNTGIGREDHVGQLRIRFDRDHVGKLTNRIAQRLPLRFRLVESQGIFVAGHPRIDHVIHGEKTRRAHQDLVVGSAHVSLFSAAGK